MKKYFLFIMTITLFANNSCKKAVDFNKDNTVSTGIGYYPVSSNALADFSTNKNLGTLPLSAGYSFKTELQFFSQDPVKEINLYNTIGSGSRLKVVTLPYAPAYSSIKRLDTLLVPYTVPVGLTIGTSIKLEYEILNQNSLNIIRPVTIKTN